MITLRPGERMLIVQGEPLFPGDDGIVTMLGYVVGHRLFVAPLGSPPFADDQRIRWIEGVLVIASAWVYVGHVDDLPTDFRLGWDIKSAYRRAVAGLS